jgi:dCTP deaminase
MSPVPMRLWPGMPVAQMSFMHMTGAAARPYGSVGLGSKYQFQEGPTPSAFHRNFDTPR